MQMSKSGQLYHSELEDCYALIHELTAALTAFTQWVHDNQKEIDWCDNQSLIPIMDNAIALLDKAKP
jgi:hypothetical protein